MNETYLIDKLIVYYSKLRLITIKYTANFLQPITVCALLQIHASTRALL